MDVDRIGEACDEALSLAVSADTGGPVQLVLCDRMKSPEGRREVQEIRGVEVGQDLGDDFRGSQQPGQGTGVVGSTYERVGVGKGLHAG